MTRLSPNNLDPEQLEAMAATLEASGRYRVIAEFVAEVPDGPPRQFRWRRVLHQVAQAEGPERIAPEWWRQPEEAAIRDYFRVEDEDGRRYWLYRQGLYGAASTPRWYMHGLCA